MQEPTPQGSIGQPLSSGDDAIQSIIPYKNVNALLAYYLGIFSCIPCLGLPLAIAAIVLGYKGLDACNANPALKGKVHAIIGIVLGTINLLISLGLIIMSLVARATQ